jgi:acyl-CoA synthetase (AMP-forming)/AMP-acid ligase II
LAARVLRLIADTLLRLQNMTLKLDAGSQHRLDSREELLGRLILGRHPRNPTSRAPCLSSARLAFALPSGVTPGAARGLRVPREVEFAAELPLTVTGKIRRNELRRLDAERRGLSP